MKNFEGNADSRLTTSRVSVLLACANEAAFIVFLTWFLFQHADRRGDGMEMAGVGFAFMLIFLPFTLACACRRTRRTGSSRVFRFLARNGHCEGCDGSQRKETRLEAGLAPFFSRQPREG